MWRGGPDVIRSVLDVLDCRCFVNEERSAADRSANRIAAQLAVAQMAPKTRQVPSASWR